jgi:hypothetical protein
LLPRRDDPRLDQHLKRDRGRISLPLQKPDRATRQIVLGRCGIEQAKDDVGVEKQQGQSSS